MASAFVVRPSDSYRGSARGSRFFSRAVPLFKLCRRLCPLCLIILWPFVHESLLCVAFRPWPFVLDSVREPRIKRQNRSRRYLGVTRMGPRNHVLNGGRDTPREGAILGVVRPSEKHFGVSAVSFNARHDVSFCISSKFFDHQLVLLRP